MTIEELKELFSRRASHRKYLPDPVPEEDIVKMVDAAHYAPSGHNLQPWKIVALTNRDTIREIADLSVTEYGKLVERLPEDARESFKKFEFFVGHFGAAPLVLVVLSKKSEIDSDRIEALYGVELPGTKCFDLDSLGVGAFIENLLLSAEVMGYGTCWVAAPVMFAQEKIETLLGIEEPWHMASIVSVAKPVRERKSAPKKGLHEVLTIRR